MAYSPNTWATNDVVTVEKLNHIENGISAAESKSFPNLVAKRYFDNNNYYLNQTLRSIVNSFLAGIPVQVAETLYADQDDNITNVFLVVDIRDLDSFGDIYTTKTIATNGLGSFYANSPDEYPIQEGGE